MERKDYLSLLLRRAQDLVARHGDEARSLAPDEFLVELDGEIGAEVQEMMRGLPHPALILPHTESGPDEFWREADDWEGAVFRAAFDCLGKDLRTYVLRILRGALPRPGEWK